MFRKYLYTMLFFVVLTVGVCSATTYIPTYEDQQVLEPFKSDTIQRDYDRIIELEDKVNALDKDQKDSLSKGLQAVGVSFAGVLLLCFIRLDRERRD